MKWLIALALVWPVAAKAADAAFIASEVLIAADWAQTRYITRHEDLYWEKYNPVLPKYPTTGQVDAWFAGAMIGNALIGYALPEKWGNYWFIGVGAVEAGYVVHNYELGIKMRF